MNFMGFSEDLLKKDSMKLVHEVLMGFRRMHVGHFLKRSWRTAHLLFMLVYGGYNMIQLWDSLGYNFVESCDA